MRPEHSTMTLRGRRAGLPASRVRRVMAVLALAGMATAAHALDAQGLFALLAQSPQGQAKFTETRHLAMLDRPLKSSGTLSFQAPGRLEKITLEPKSESLVLDGERLTIVRDGKTLRVNLRSHPQALAFVEAIRGVLLGNYEMLEQNYRTLFSGSEDNWNVQLTPKDTQAGVVIKQIKVGGQGALVRSIELLQADGDRSVMQIEPLAAPAKP